MSEIITDEIPSSFNGLITETDNTIKETGVQNEDEETWLYRNNKSKNDENIDNTIAPSIDEITTQEIDMRKKTTSSIGNQLDDDDSDDEVIVYIGNYEPEISTFPTNRQKNRSILPPNPMIQSKPSTVRGGVDFDVQGVINGQPTYEHDIKNDEEKPWKKPGADITDYFNYGFTEETWAQYSERQRRLRAENNLARLNINHMPPMPPMISGHPPMVHPMNPHPMMMVNKSINMPMMQRPMNIRKPDGKIGVIGSTDQTSRRPMFEAPNNFEPPPFMNGPPFPGGQTSNGQTVGDLISTSPSANGHPPSHGAPSGGTHHIQTLGAHRLPMMTLPPGMQFRPQFGHPHGPGGLQFFPHGPVPGMHNDRPPQPYFMAHHPQQQQQQQQQQPWDKTGIPPVHSFPPGSFPPQNTAPTTGNNARAPSSRSPTPENNSSRSSTPEENRPNASASGENEKSSKDDRYKERYRDDRDHHSSSRRRLSPKDRSSSSSYRPHHRSSEHEYERPRNDRKSSRDRDDKYERYSRKRNYRDDNSRHHQGDDESSRSHRSSGRTPSKTNPSLSAPTESSQTLNEQAEIVSEFDQPTSSSPSMNRSYRDDSERSSSRHSHHKKSSKRSRHDSGDERSNTHHHRRSKDQSSSSNKKSTNQTESVSDVKDQINE